MVPSSNRRKRRSRDWGSAQAQDLHQHTCKRPRIRGVLTPPPPPSHFWDNLSEIHLTRTALQELDRRNAVVSQRYRRPITRGVSKINDRPPTVPSVDTLIQHYSARDQHQLRRFARYGGPDMSEARGVYNPCARRSKIPTGHQRHRQQQPASTVRQSRPPGQNPTPMLPSMRPPTPGEQPSAQTTSTQNTGPYNRNFEQHLIDHNIYQDEYQYPDGREPPLPSNWAEINVRLRAPRRSLSPSIFKQEDFRKFKRADAHALKEKQVTTSVIPTIEGFIRDARCTSGGNPFRNLDDLTDGTIVPGNPDIYYGARPGQLAQRVREELNGFIVPSTQTSLPVAPNFFLAAKGPDGTASVALRQACYDGALGARAMDRLQRYGGLQPPTRGGAYTITSSYHDGHLKMYTSHCALPADRDGRPEYYMHQLGGWSMTGNAETFRQGATAYRNARDWAREQRNIAIENANTVARAPASEGASPDSPTASTETESVAIAETESLEIPETESVADSNTTFEAVSPQTTAHQLASSLDKNKRTRQHLQGSSPIQTKRTRVENLDDSPSIGS